VIQNLKLHFEQLNKVIINICFKYFHSGAKKFTGAGAKFPPAMEQGQNFPPAIQLKYAMQTIAAYISFNQPYQNHTPMQI